MSMTWDDAAELLALCATFDQRKGDELDVRAWHQVAILHRWTAGAAIRAVVEHYGSGQARPRITPAAITDAIRDARRRAAVSFVAPRIPDGQHSSVYPAWYRAQLAAHVDAVVERWAAGEPIPTQAVETAGHRELPVGQAPAALRPQISRDLARIGSLGQGRRQPGVLGEGLRRAYERLNPRRRAEARAELDATRAVTEGGPSS